MSSDGRPTFSLRDVFVAMTVICFLLALLPSGVQQARTGSFSNTCRGNLHHLLVAVQNYAHAQGSYPGYLNTLTFRPRPALGSPAEDRVSWLVPLLPYLERSDMYSVYRTGEYLSSAAQVDPRSVQMQLLVCPANRRHAGRPKPPPCAYIVNAGRADVVARPLCDGTAGVPADWQDNGVFFNHYVDGVENPRGAPLVWQSPDYVARHDGGTHTLLLSERLDAGSYSYPVQSAADVEAELGFVWWPVATSNPPFNPLPASRRINGPADPLAINNARPSSNHVGGVNVAFCSGNVQCVEANIDYGVWCRLMTPHDAGVNDPGALVPVPAGPTNNFGYLRGNAPLPSEYE